jgi:hypothetical protein
MARCQPIEGMKKPLGLESDTKLEDTGSPRWGIVCGKMLAILCVASSLALVALGGSNPLMGFDFEP